MCVLIAKYTLEGFSNMYSSYVGMRVKKHFHSKRIFADLLNKLSPGVTLTGNRTQKMS